MVIYERNANPLVIMKIILQDNEIKTYLISLILRSLIIVEWMLILRLQNQINKLADAVGMEAQ